MQVCALLAVGMVGPTAMAQGLPWDLFQEDPSSSFGCDVVNAENVELVVLRDTGQLVLVTGPDVILVDTFVDDNGDVFFGSDPVGFITFADDGDGFPSLWWLSFTGTVVRVDGLTGEPTETNLFPSDFVATPCDACEFDFWDDPTPCAATVAPVSTPEPASLNVPPFTFNFCGTGASLAMAMTMLGLSATGLVRRRIA